MDEAEDEDEDEDGGRGKDVQEIYFAFFVGTIAHSHSYALSYLQTDRVIWHKGILTLYRRERIEPRTEIVALAKGGIHVK